MKKSIDVRINYFYNTLYQIVNMLIPIVTAPYLSRVFGAEGVGIFSFTTSVVSVFILIATFGTAQYGQRELAMIRDDRKKFSINFWEIEILNIILSCVCLLFWFIFCFLTNEYNIIYFILSFQLLSVVFDISWLYGSVENFKTITIRNSIIKIIGLILTFILVKSSADLNVYVAIIALSVLLGNISTWFGIFKIVDRVKIKELNIFRHFKNTFIYFIPALATSIYTILDKTMIGYITGDMIEGGYYEQATKIISIAKTLVFSFNNIMYARMSYYFSKGDFDNIKNNLKNSLSIICLISIPLMFGLIGVSKEFVPLFFGDGFDSVINLIYLLSPIVFVVSISNYIGTQYLTPIGKRKESSKVIITGAFINFILNLILIPSFKSYGAIFASIIAELYISIVYIHMSSEYLNFKDIFINSYKKVIAGFIMLLFIFLVSTINLIPIFSLILEVLVGIAVYFSTLLILKDDFLKKIKFLKE